MLKLTRRDKIEAINNINAFAEKFATDESGAYFIDVLIETVKSSYKIPIEVDLSLREALLIMLATEEQKKSC